MASLLTLSLAVFIIFWDSKPEIFLGRKPAAISALPTADSYMRNIVTRKFNENGRPAFVLTATEGDYFQSLNKSIMISPQMLIHSKKEGDQPWHLNAEQSVILNSGQQIDLQDNVYAWQKTTSYRATRTSKTAGGVGAMTGKNEINTPFLSYYPDDQKASTSKEISFKSPEHNITGIGFSGDFAAQTYQIHSRVKGRHNAFN